MMAPPASWQKKIVCVIITAHTCGRTSQMIFMTEICALQITVSIEHPKIIPNTKQKRADDL